MRNQVLEFNLDSIEKIGIFENPVEFFQANCANEGSHWKRLRFKSHKLKANDHNKKKARKFKVVVEILMGIQLHRIKSLKLIGGAIESIKHWGTKLYFSHTNFACPCTVPTLEQCRNTMLRQLSAARDDVAVAVLSPLQHNTQHAWFPPYKYNCLQHAPGEGRKRKERHRSSTQRVKPERKIGKNREETEGRDEGFAEEFQKILAKKKKQKKQIDITKITQ